MSEFFLVLIVLCGFYLTSVSAAQAPLPIVMDSITVTATRMEKQPEDIPAAVGVVDKDRLQFATQQLGLDESLVSIPGIFMQNRYNFA